jgi:cytidylate kinase
LIDEATKRKYDTIDQRRKMSRFIQSEEHRVAKLFQACQNGDIEKFKKYKDVYKMDLSIVDAVMKYS